MPNVQFPNVPNYPGVPLLVRPAQIVVAQTPALAIGLGTLENFLIGALQQAPRWGIFDSDGNQLGIDPAGTASILAQLGSAAESLLTGQSDAVLSTFRFDFVRETRVSNFQVEGGGFANYNKVILPAAPQVTLILEGSESDRTNFLNAIDDACQSTDLFNVVTPEVTYVDYNLTRYSYRRTASQGATLLMVEVSMEEIRQVSATFAVVATPINNPANPAAVPQANNGITQTTPIPESTLRSLFNKITN